MSTKNIKKQNTWLFLLKRHHCIIRFNLMQGTTKSGNWRSSSLIHFAPCVRMAPYGPITKSIKKLQYFLIFFAQARLTSNTCFGRNFMRIYQLTFMSQIPSGSGTPSPSSHQISWCMSHVTSWYNEKGLSGNRYILFTAIFMEYDDETLDFSGYKYNKPRMI